MIGMNLLEGRTGPQTQSVEAVKALLTWKGRAVDPLPSVVEFANEGEESRLVLVLSNKKNAYYVTTATKCSCPSQVYRGGTCKHMRKFFAEQIAKPEARRDEPLIQRGGFKPISLLPSEEKAAKAVPSMLIDMHDTSDREAAYHSIREDKILWPAEA